jgi:membrane fusion protein (multidrug efflux system)
MTAVQSEVSRQATESVPPPSAATSRTARKAYLVLAFVTLAGVGAYFGYGFLKGNQANTDNAQLESDVVPLAPRVAGPIAKLHVVDNQTVQAGELIAEIDPRDYEIKVAQAQADLEAAKAQAETSASHDGAARPNAAAVAAAGAALARAEAEARKAEVDLTRSRSLKAQSAITAVELENAQNAAEKARAAREQAQAQLQVAEEQHGFAEAKVKSAEAALDQAKAQLEYTKIYAPRAGTLSKIAVQEGQIVAAGQTLAQLVSSDTYIVANFKETQIGRMQAGQRAEIEVDAFPGKRLEGRVESLSAATGARFSLLPPDNASGNFVKVVQRVPVKIRLEQASVGDTPLKAGLSADVTVYFK